MRRREMHTRRRIRNRTRAWTSAWNPYTCASILSGKCFFQLRHLWLDRRGKLLFHVPSSFRMADRLAYCSGRASGDHSSISPDASTQLSLVCTETSRVLCCTIEHRGASQKYFDRPHRTDCNTSVVYDRVDECIAVG